MGAWNSSIFCHLKAMMFPYRCAKNSLNSLEYKDTFAWLWFPHTILKKSTLIEDVTCSTRSWYAFQRSSVSLSFVFFDSFDCGLGGNWFTTARLSAFGYAI
jgi:hypothetical protein